MEETCKCSKLFVVNLVSWLHFAKYVFSGLHCILGVGKGSVASSKKYV